MSQYIQMHSHKASGGSRLGPSSSAMTTINSTNPIIQATDEVSSSTAQQFVRRLTSAVATSVLPHAELSISPTLSSSIIVHATNTENLSSSSHSSSLLLHDLIAGGIAGSCGVIVGHPLDSLKVRMQMINAGASSASASSPSIAASLTRSNAQFGSVWKGLGAPFTMATVINAAIFFTYGGTTRIWDEYHTERNKVGAITESATATDGSFKRSATCGGVTGIVSSLFLCPSEHVKTKLQTQQQQRQLLQVSSVSRITYRDSFHATQHILTNHGVTGLYRGLLATLARQTPSFAVYFGTYDRMKDYTTEHYFGKKHSLLASITSGGIAGSLAWAVVYPVDLIKSRIQALPLDVSSRAERSMITVAQKVVRDHGWRALYRGLGITIMRAFPVNGIIFPVYEITLNALRER